MAFYADEEDAWKCPQHPSRPRCPGVCPICLRDKLSALCPECASVRPCSCCSSSSSSSSSFSSFSFPGEAIFSGGLGSIGRVSSLIESEPSYQRSRSAALPHCKAVRFPATDETNDQKDSSAVVEKSKSSHWLFFWPHRSKRKKIPADPVEEDAEDMIEFNISPIRRSKSLADSCTGAVAEDSRSAKSKGWYFPSPMKVFWNSKTSAKIVHEQSPLHRG